MVRKAAQVAALAAGLALGASNRAAAQSADAASYSVSTPRPINPAQGTTNPSAQATQSQNPYLGSVPQKNTGTHIDLDLKSAIERGMRFNLGLIESNQANANVREERLRALAALLPQLSAEAQQAYENLSLKEVGIKLPAIPGVGPLPATTGGFGYQDARVSLNQAVFNQQLREQYRARKEAERASSLSVQDSRDVVVFAVATAYLTAIASEARVETTKAQLASATEIDRLTTDRVKSELSPQIDALRSQVERQSAEQRLTNVSNQFEKDKLTLARIIGLAMDQDFSVTDPLIYRPVNQMTYESAKQDALQTRRDLRSAEATVRSAESSLHAEKAQRLPSVEVNANLGGAGVNVGNFNTVYSVSAGVSVPIYTGGRIRAEIGQAQAELNRRQAEYDDLRGRVAYDVRVAWLDAGASDSSVKVAQRNKALAEQALTQSKDRYQNGVTNYLEVVQAQEALTAANENYIDSLFSYNVALISLARSMGAAETRLPQLMGGN